MEIEGVFKVSYVRIEVDYGWYIGFLNTEKRRKVGVEDGRRG